MTLNLADIRKKIDTLDEQILSLLSARAQCAVDVAEVKKRDGDQDPVFYRPEREAQVLRRIQALNQGPLDDEEVARLFREIMSACLAAERPTRVAYLGPEGTFTQAAALKHFGQSSQTEPFPTIGAVFREVEAGNCRYGVVPVENSTEGVVSHTLDRFMGTSLKICGEVELRIHQNLMIGPNTDAKNITRIYSHSQSLSQCREWLDTHYPRAERVAVNSNAEAARRVHSEWNSAAIAGSIAAQIYQLSLIAERIEDRPDNSTRFLIIGDQDTPPSGAEQDKTSIMIEVRNRPGVLFELLAPFRDQSIDLTRLESRPAQGEKWNYVFFLDFIGHKDDEKLSGVFGALHKLGADVRILGSYPIAVI